MADCYDFDGEPIGFREWAHLFESADRIVARDEVAGGYAVSTVWLGLDHGFGFSDRPLIFETMVFRGSRSDLECRRWASREEAEAGHAELLNEVRLLAELDAPAPAEAEEERS